MTKTKEIKIGLVYTPVDELTGSESVDVLSPALAAEQASRRVVDEILRLPSDCKITVMIGVMDVVAKKPAKKVRRRKKICAK